MLNRIVAYVLITALVCSTFQRYVIYAGYELNNKYIASKLCENRDKPWMHCNGKCYFMKKLKQAEEREKSEEGQAQKSLIQQVFHSKPLAVKFHSHILQVMPVPNSKVSLPQVYYPIFRPPQLG
jgi:hypothetical protein